MASTAQNRELLTSWKEIATYFGKGVRTVQRWETIGLPVHRPSEDKNIVMADVRELSAWALRRRTRPTSPEQERCRQLIEDSQKLAAQTRVLLLRSESLIRSLRTFHRG